MTTLLSMLGAFVVVTSAPALALAHGIAHAHEAEHEREHAREHSARQSPVDDRNALVTVEDSGHDEHQHLQSAAAVTVRAYEAQFILAHEVALTPGADTSAASSEPRAESADMPDGPRPDRASQPRAPPLG